MGVKFVIPNIVYRQSFRLNFSLIQLTSIASVPSGEVIYQQSPSFLVSVIIQLYVWTVLIRDGFHTSHTLCKTLVKRCHIYGISRIVLRERITSPSKCLFSQWEIMHSLMHFYIVCRQHVLRQVLLNKYFFE